MTKQTLERRIADALNDQHPDRSELAELVVGAVAAVDAAKQTITTESAKAEDINTDDPDTCEELVKQAERRITRITKAFDELKSRIQQIDAADYSATWLERHDELEMERNALARELTELYPVFCGHIQGLYQRIDQNTHAINQLHMQAPRGEPRRLLDAELAARKLHSYSAEQPRLRDALRLPSFERTLDIAFPPPVINSYFAAFEGTIAAMNAKTAGSYGPDWHEARKLQDEEERAQRVKLEADAKRKAEEEKQAYHRALLREDRARRGLRD